jgi:hypothetical protein
VRRVLETRDVKNEGEFLVRMMAAYRRKMTAPGLPHLGAVVRGDDHGLSAGGNCKRSAPRLKARNVAAVNIDVGAVATSEAREFIEVHATLAHLCQRDAAVEQFLGKPSPRPFPRASRVDGQGIERHDQRSKPAVRWF